MVYNSAYNFLNFLMAIIPKCCKTCPSFNCMITGREFEWIRKNAHNTKKEERKLELTFTSYRKAKITSYRTVCFITIESNYTN